MNVSARSMVTDINRGSYKDRVYSGSYRLSSGMSVLLMVVERKEVQGLMASTHPRRRQVTGRPDDVLRTWPLEIIAPP